MQLKKKTSILLVDNSGKENKIIQIPSKILLNWKKYFLILSTIIFVLLSIIGVFIYQKTSEHYKEKLARANKIKSQVDLLKVKESFQSIDESIAKINNFLVARGLKKLKIENAGGENDIALVDINELADYYSGVMNDLDKKLMITPIGFPANGEISSLFGYRNNPFGGRQTEYHSGIDFKGKIGDPIKATAEGVVVFAGTKGGYGRCVIIKHDKQFKTLYGHLSKIKVKNNQKVMPGDVIGQLGSTGRSTGPHLHYEVIQNDKKINPKLFLNL